jgi:hypothetical protein
MEIYYGKRKIVLLCPKPPAGKWAFLSRRLDFRVGGKNKK